MGAQKHILVAGAGIAGPALAIALKGSEYKITIVEKSSTFRTSGQQIDVSGAGKDVLKRLGLYEAVRARTTGEKGFQMMDQANHVVAEFLADATNDVASPTRELEIMRGDLAKVLYDASKDHTEFLFGNHITALKEQSSCITASFATGPDRDFDLVVAADGLGSHTRALAFPKSEVHIRSLKQVVAWLSLPFEEADGDCWRWYNAPGARCVNTRPRAQDRITGGYLAWMTPDSGKISRLPVQQQKAEFTRVFSDAGWQSSRILDAMNKADSDFYVQETAQVKMSSWVSGRVALVGDAGYCPSPISGQGTTLAFIGAYILAGCLASKPNDLTQALHAYQEEVRPFVDKAQDLPPGAPALALPHTALGVWTLRTLAWLVSSAVRLGIATPLGWISGPLSKVFGSKELELPRYPALDSLQTQHTE